MLRTRITELFGIKYPIIGGAMIWISRAEFVSAVSNAGGLGLLALASFHSPEELRDDIRRTKDLTDKPFGVNIPIGPAVRQIDYDGMVNVIIEEGVQVVETAGRKPDPYMPLFKEAGIKVYHKVADVRHALSAEKIGMDAIAVLGYEGAGHVGLNDVTNFVMIRSAARALKVPVIAAGAISDAESLIAALALGAEGAIIGTGLLAAKECFAHERIKQWLIESRETDTTIIERAINNSARVMKNSVAEKVLKIEEREATVEELFPFISGLKVKELMETGNQDAGILHCGQGVGLLCEEKSVKDIINGIMNGIEAVSDRLKALGTFN